MSDKKLHDKIKNIYTYASKKDPAIILMKLKEAGYNMLLSDLKKILDSLPLRQKFKRTKETKSSKQVYPFILDQPRELFQLDLMFMTKDYEYRYILCVVDAFSRYAWCWQLKNKTDITSYLGKLFESGEKPIAIGTDNGTEFINTAMKEFLAQQGVFHKIGMVRNSTSQAIVERFNGTLRRGLIHFKHWSKALQPVVSDYNNTYHSTIKMKPKEAHTNRIEEARTNIIERATKLINKTKSNKKFAEGDKVRIILLHKGMVKKSTAQTWSDDVYTVRKVEVRNNGEFIYLEGMNKGFTKNQLLKIS